MTPALAASAPIEPAAMGENPAPGSGGGNAADGNAGGPPEAEAVHDLRWRDLLSNRGILIFAACAALFTMSNAAMLPIASSAITRRST